jgi:hypothetical protein
MTNNDHPSMICRTCQRALDLIISVDGAHYIHALADPDNHKAVPVLAPAGWHGKCDFCAADNSTHVLPARDFTVPGAPEHLSAGNWAACDACTDLIRNEHWEWLIARVIARFHAVYGYPMPRSGQRHLARLYHALDLATTGAIRPIEA